MGQNLPLHSPELWLLDPQKLLRQSPAIVLCEYAVTVPFAELLLFVNHLFGGSYWPNR